MQSITNAAGGKCQRAHHIISAPRWRPAERETCQLLTAGMLKKKFLLSFRAASRRRIIQVAGTTLPSGHLAGGRSSRKRTNKTISFLFFCFFFLLLLKHIYPETRDRQRLIAGACKPLNERGVAKKSSSSSSRDTESNRRRRTTSQTST